MKGYKQNKLIKDEKQDKEEQKKKKTNLFLYVKRTHTNTCNIFNMHVTGYSFSGVKTFDLVILSAVNYFFN